MSDNLSLHHLPSLAPSSTLNISDNFRPTSTTTNNTHKENHPPTQSAYLRDFIIGFSDGLTVPFALCAALSTLDSSKVVISGGLAELFAGSLSMGIGAVLASLTERTQYRIEEAREWAEVRQDPVGEENEIYDILGRYGVGRQAAKGVVGALRGDEGMWVKVCPCVLEF